MSSAAHADNLVLGFGPTLNGNTNPKAASLGYEYTFGEASLLSECRGIFSERLNGACEVVLSARVETTSDLFMRLGVGPAWYFYTDDRVSSNFNFNLQGCIGLTQDAVILGACWVHYSNAGIAFNGAPNPNLGRDFLSIMISIRLGPAPAPTRLASEDIPIATLSTTTQCRDGICHSSPLP